MAADGVEGCGSVRRAVVDNSAAHPSCVPCRVLLTIRRQSLADSAAVLRRRPVAKAKLAAAVEWWASARERNLGRVRSSNAAGQRPARMSAYLQVSPVDSPRWSQLHDRLLAHHGRPPRRPEADHS